MLEAFLGRPDLTLKRYRLAIFVDSEFFHGKDWETSKFIIKSHRDFWWKKIESNIERDIVVNKHLREIGWIVLRFWSDEVTYEQLTEELDDVFGPNLIDYVTDDCILKLAADILKNGLQNPPIGNEGVHRKLVHHYLERDMLRFEIFHCNN